jgi:hypothetical protein
MGFSFKRIERLYAQRLLYLRRTADARLNHGKEGRRL